MEVTDLGVNCADIIQEADRRKSPGPRLNFHKCSVFRAQRKEGEKPRVGTEIEQEDR